MHRGAPYAAPMPELGLTRSRRDLLVDIAVVLVMLWFTLAQFGSQGFGQYKDVATEPDTLGFGLIFIESLALLWRRRFPWPVFLLAIAVSIALVSLGYAVHAPAAVAVGLFTLAARRDRGRRDRRVRVLPGGLRLPGGAPGGWLAGRRSAPHDAPAVGRGSRAAGTR